MTDRPAYWLGEARGSTPGAEGFPFRSHRTLGQVAKDEKKAKLMDRQRGIVPPSDGGAA